MALHQGRVFLRLEVQVEHRQSALAGLALVSRAWPRNQLKNLVTSAEGTVNKPLGMNGLSALTPLRLSGCAASEHRRTLAPGLYSSRTLPPTGGPEVCTAKLALNWPMGLAGIPQMAPPNHRQWQHNGHPKPGQP